jgi:hypothetical protein
MKPPVVVIERHCKTNQCWIAVRFKKIPSVAKISQSPEASAREKVRTNEFHSAIAGFSSCVRAPLSKVLSLTLAVSLVLVTVETVPRAKKAARRASRRAAGRSFRPADSSVTEPAVAAAPACLACLRAIADQQRGRPRPPVACARLRAMRPRQQPHHRAFYVRSCTNIDRVNRLQRAHERECGGPRAPPRA